MYSTALASEDGPWQGDRYTVILHKCIVSNTTLVYRHVNIKTERLTWQLCNLK
jgi:hypothetical protein